MERAIKTSEATFVGTVVELENYRRWATVDVLETWHGVGLPDQVLVKAGPKDPAGPSRVASSIERTYRLDQTYLFVVYGSKGSAYRDSNCSNTTRFDEDVERFRPASVAITSPTPSSTLVDDEPSRTDIEESNYSPVAGLVGLLIALLAGAGIFFLIRRGRRR